MTKIDTQLLINNTDLLDLVQFETELKQVASTEGGEYAGPCPFCGGHDRFRVQPYHSNGARWYCRGCGEERWHDAIDYVMRHDSVDFITACKILGAESFSLRSQTPIQNVHKSSTPIPPPLSDWQVAAKTFLEECEQNLWEAPGIYALDYLHNRGLNDETIKRYKLGYNPERCYESLGKWGLSNTENSQQNQVYLPRGITIPCTIDEKVWYIKIRQNEGQPKYLNVKGGRSALFGADNLRGELLILLTEGEFDAILADQELGDICGIATLGSASNNLDLPTWGRYLMPAQKILVAQDSDDAGMRGSAEISKKSAQIYSVRIPVLQLGDKDITDYVLAGGNLREWILHHLNHLGVKPTNNENQESATTQVPEKQHHVIDLNELINQPRRYEPSKPCFACSQIAWIKRDGLDDWYCGECHPTPGVHAVSNKTQDKTIPDASSSKLTR